MSDLHDRAIRRRAVLALGLAFAAGTASWTWAGEVPVTLSEAQALAGQANPELQAAWARVDAHLARAESVRRVRRPRVDLSTAWSRTDLPAAVFADTMNAGQLSMADLDVARINDPGPLGHLGTSLSLEVPIDVFGTLATLASAMAAAADAGDAGARDAVEELRLRVTEAYRQGEMARQSVKVTERVLAVAQAREAEIEARFETGGALRADLLRARARRREREADLAVRRGEQRMALATLARLLGAPAGTSYVPTEGPPAVAALDADEAAWVERALRQRPVLEMARRRTDSASAFLKSEKKRRLPAIGAFGQLRDDRIDVGHGRASWAVGIGLRWTPFDPARSTREAAAAAEQKAAELDAKAASDQVRLEVALAYRRAVAARERHAAAAGGAEEGREALRVVQERRQEGMATLTDELETEAASLGAALQEIGATSDVAVADAALKRAAGEIGR